MSKDSDPDVQLFSYADDQPCDGYGMLIPRRDAKPLPAPTPPKTAAAEKLKSLAQAGGKGALAAAAVLALMLLGSTGYGLVSEWNLAAAPTVMIVDPAATESTELGYGPQPALAAPAFFTDTRDAFIEGAETFVEVDLTGQQVRFFKRGVLLQSAEVFAEGARGSWLETPSGLYRVTEKDTERFNVIGQVTLPWQITFGGNFVMHGWPRYPDDTAVPPEFTGGGIRLSDLSAELLYSHVAVGTPVLVHKVELPEPDAFVYEPQVPELETPHYFVADLQNGTILAASDREAPAPIASIVKLMTAVVAAETVDLNSRVRATSPTFVTSLIPRLADRGSVSMYSLLQLLLVESSNEAAETIAGELGREEFIAAMNAKARQLGMLDTHFADPSGLSADNVSTAADLYRLVQYIHKDRSFIFEITNHTALPSAYSNGEFDGLINFNNVEEMDSFVGGKVGETRAAGQTSVSLHELSVANETRTLVVILLGSSDRTADIQTLLTYVEQRFSRE